MSHLQLPSLERSIGCAYLQQVHNAHHAQSAHTSILMAQNLSIGKVCCQPLEGNLVELIFFIGSEESAEPLQASKEVSDRYGLSSFPCESVIEVERGDIVVRLCRLRRLLGRSCRRMA